MAVILIAAYFMMASVGAALVVLMTIQIAGKLTIVAGLVVAGCAVLPDTCMGAEKNGKEAFMLAKIGGMPIKHRVAFVALERKANLAMHGILGLAVQLAVTGVASRLQHGKLAFHLSNMTSLTIQSRMRPDQWKRSACMSAAHVKNLPS